VDDQATVVVQSISDPQTSQLHFFGNKKRMGWPYVAVPLARGSGAMVRGVLGVDSFEQCGKGREDDEQPEPGVVEFLSSVGAMLGTVMDLRAKADALKQLESVTKVKVKKLVKADNNNYKSSSSSRRQSNSNSGTVGVSSSSSCAAAAAGEDEGSVVGNASVVAGGLSSSGSSSGGDIGVTMEEVWSSALEAIQENVLFSEDVSLWRVEHAGRRKKSVAVAAAKEEAAEATTAPAADAAIGKDDAASSSPCFPALILVVNLVRAFDLPKVMVTATVIVFVGQIDCEEDYRIGR
jgi:hypothetical protein